MKCHQTLTVRQKMPGRGPKSPIAANSSRHHLPDSTAIYFKTLKFND
jgi:hypothetical protein